MMKARIISNAGFLFLDKSQIINHFEIQLVLLFE